MAKKMTSGSPAGNTLAYTLISLLVFMPLFGRACAQIPVKLNDALASYGVIFDLPEEPNVQQDFTFIAKQKEYRTITAQARNTRVEMEIIKPFTADEAGAYTGSQYAIVKALYSPQIIPYTGEFTVTTDCPPDKKPQESTLEILGKKTAVLVANATERYTFGVWEEDLIKQRGVFYVVYDHRSATIYKITLFRPVEEFNLQEMLNIAASFSRLTS
ncbi:MAG: hypothetical protein PHR11_02400 [Candidatus Omnitrophica bacterium]|nr:hypothetical protein [Candidatus Omnitrophota bacterium]